MSETNIQTETTLPQAGIRWSSVLVWGGILAFLALLGWGVVNTNKPRPEAGQPAPDFSMAFFDDYQWQGKQEASLSEMRGNIVVLNFWASWCAPCRMEAGLLEAAWQKYADQGVILLGVAYADAEPKAIDFLEEFSISYPNAPDIGTRVSRSYEITGVPETFVIGRDGVIAYVQPGPITAATLDNVLSGLLLED